VDLETAGSLVTFAEEARAGLTGLDGASVQAELEERRPELLAALEWLVGHDRPEEAFRLASALVPFWMATKRIEEGNAWFERILSLPRGPPAGRARALYEHGYLIFWAGDDERSDERLLAALELARLENDPTVIALAQERGERAAVLLGIADAALADAGGEWPPDERVQHDETVARLTAQLGPDGFGEAGVVERR
jgi:hypothetical protein